MTAAIVLLASLAFALFVYFLPAVIACSRRHPNALPIVVLDLLLGWTFVGWVIALVWALTAFPRPERPPSAAIDPDDWQNQQVEFDPQRAEWAARAGRTYS